MPARIIISVTGFFEVIARLNEGILLYLRPASARGILNMPTIT